MDQLTSQEKNPPGAGNLFLGSLITLLVVVFVPFAVSYLDWMPRLNVGAWYILSVTAIGLILKLIFADSAGSGFEFSKFGYDFCAIAFAGILTCFAIQIVSDQDLFPGINNIILIKDIPAMTNSVPGNRSAQLLIAFLIALIVTYFAAKLSAEVKISAAKNIEKPELSLLNGLLGTLLLGSYLLILISKG